ncbi:unnamed protein product [Mesocestoides corti]|uniref:Seipin n=1 Tax=Mesocestoides corti TaxID=53468 RepID=A0A0R3UJE8_MESCO|nr:unnamed protein product [Mesocestoides corti]
MHGNHSTTLSNTLLPIYRPWLIDTADTLLYAPLYLLRLWKKEQTLTTVLSSDYVDNQEFPTGSGRLVLETNGLRWYSATLIISAVLSPLTWLLYRYPWIAGVVFVVTVILTLNCLTLCESLLRRYRRTSVPKPLPSATVGTKNGLEDENDIIPIQEVKPADVFTG